ncbi:MAG TPA: arsenite methyltransferase [Candidatus Krumholzibacteria bacterium]|nr:arsenite methyltransferase [Candidatus Krumholzibacteria bacterium]
MDNPTDPHAVRDTVRERYGEAARNVARNAGATSCCSGSCGTGPMDAVDPITKDLYQSDELDGIPDLARLASLGCGNPTALAELHEGETVLDLGSGGGIDVLLSARRVGPTGRAFGVDMTREMLAIARTNAEAAGATNVEFREGTLETLPFDDHTVDVIISNCVINLAGDKDRVLAEAHRVTKPGGRFAVSDVVLTRPLPSAVQSSVALWTGCVSGALTMDDYRARLERAGYTDVSFEITREYSRDDIAGMAESVPASEGGPQRVIDHLDEIDGAVVSAFVRARRA